MSNIPSPAVDKLLSANAVRERAEQMFSAAEANQLTHFRVCKDQLPAVVSYVAEVMRTAYPDGNVPYHARWRHFDAGGVIRTNPFFEQLSAEFDRSEQLRIMFDLVIISVLLDAGAGPTWQYDDKQHELKIGRSEGLALASWDMFIAGAFANDGKSWRVDSDRLQSLTANDLGSGFQVTSENPLHGLEGRLNLLQRLGKACCDQDYFGSHARPGGIGDLFSSQESIEAPTILARVLRAFAPIWPGRLMLDGFPLGDTWFHPAIKTDDSTSGYVPFHKLSQWLTYSLVEPLEQTGHRVVDLDGLTGLPEYRNGGLFIDMGVLELKDQSAAKSEHRPDSEIIVEWRALTVALLDRVAAMMREQGGLDSVHLPLAKVLEGGTWAAGRKIAKSRRADGAPPLNIVSDGTVF